MSLMGGMGLLSTSLILPVFGMVYEYQLSRSGVSFLDDVNRQQGTFLNWHKPNWMQGAITLRYVAILPVVLIVGFFNITP